MMLFSTGDVTLDRSFFEAQRRVDVTCPAHLHYSMEIVCVIRGTVCMEVGGIQRRIGAGEGTLVLPYEPHSFDTPEKSECFIISFSPELTPEFYENIRDREPAVPVCAIPAWALQMCAGQLPVGCPLRGSAAELQAKALLYPLCELFYGSCRFEKLPGSLKKDTFSRILRYIGTELPDGALSQEAAARALGIHPVYLSRLFCQCSGVSYTKYVNMMRCFYAMQMLKKFPERSISQVALEAGFGSIRSFNREFRAVYGLSPRQKRGSSSG